MTETASKLKIIVYVKISFKDYSFFGLENGDACFCGFDDSKFVPSPNSECNKPCNGAENEICGGSWRLSLYECRLFKHEVQRL